MDDDVGCVTTDDDNAGRPLKEDLIMGGKDLSSGSSLPVYWNHA